MHSARVLRSQRCELNLCLGYGRPRMGVILLGQVADLSQLRHLRPGLLEAGSCTIWNGGIRECSCICWIRKAPVGRHLHVRRLCRLPSHVAADCPKQRPGSLSSHALHSTTLRSAKNSREVADHVANRLRKPRVPQQIGLEVLDRAKRIDGWQILIRLCGESGTLEEGPGDIERRPVAAYIEGKRCRSIEGHEKIRKDQVIQVVQSAQGFARPGAAIELRRRKSLWDALVPAGHAVLA
mmetsp:Transcript_55703/g.129901  ORF Transcript_55703/g.129901 Transcript_55703/m.129901 type:complete len:238 (+) Transcript_55703:342-1055(+)